ncbi:MAG TPA: hypothetical protein VFO70_06410 [Chitinophagaceae bacterium]|nr:hypothetical protein [Chitinophagaceae bacterium]
MKKLSFLALILAISGSIAAQENHFLVYSFKGNVSVVENKNETKVKVGRLLNENSTLKLTSGAVVTLICNETAMFTLKKAGSYSLEKLGDSCRVTNNSFSANYVKYVWAQMTKTSAAPGSNRKLFMNTVGAVSRSVNNIWIDPRLDTVNYSGGDFPLSWKSYADAKEFEFSLYQDPANKDPLFKSTVSKLKIPIPQFVSKIKPGNTYYWTAAVKGEENNELKVLHYVDKEHFSEVLKGLKETTGPFENAAEEAYRVAFLLEDARFLAEAYQYYTKAATLAPDVPLYRSTLMSFKKDYEIK